VGAGAAMVMHFPFRVVGSSTKLSFPETGLGFYPAGAAFALSRLGPYGMYLALTGAPATGEDLL
jgi:enoyl-CoA hydratase/carnithine racemase